MAGSSNLSLGAKCKPNLTRVSSRSAQAKCNTGNVNSSTGLQIYSVSLMDRTGGYGPSDEGSNPSPGAIKEKLNKEGEIMIFPVQLHDVEEARRCNQIATEQDFSIYISCDNVTIDVRSILGLLTLIGKTGVLVAPDHVSPEAFTKALRKMKLIH